VGLGAVLDDLQAVTLGDGHDRRHIGGMTVKVNRDNGFYRARGLFLDRIRGAVHIHCGRRRIDVRQHRCSAGQLDGGDCGNRGVGNGQHRIPRSHTTGPQGNMQRVRTAPDPDSMLDAEIVSKLLLESGDFVAENVHSAVQYSMDRLIDFIPMHPVVCGRISWKDHSRFPRGSTSSYVLPQIISIERHSTGERIAQRHPRLPLQDGPDSTKVREVIADVDALAV
jgi:hypothetical protein